MVLFIGAEGPTLARYSSNNVSLSPAQCCCKLYSRTAQLPKALLWSCPGVFQKQSTRWIPKIQDERSLGTNKILTNNLKLQRRKPLSLKSMEDIHIFTGEGIQAWNAWSGVDFAFMMPSLLSLPLRICGFWLAILLGVAAVLWDMGLGQGSLRDEDEQIDRAKIFKKRREGGE
eukprot:jgi/Botrbrau1/16503/Bobra.0142s0097.1